MRNRFSPKKNEPPDFGSPCSSPTGREGSPHAHEYWDRHTAPTNLPGDEGLTVDRFPEELAFYLTPEQEFAYEAVGGFKGRRILEIGAGVGVNALHMAAQGARVVAVDMSRTRLAILKRVAGEMGLEGKVWPVCARAEQLPLREGVADAAYSKSSLIHTDLPAALGEIRRALREEGRGVFCEPTTSNPFVWLYRRFLGPQEWRSITHYFGRREERALAEAFGGVRAGDFYFTAFVAFYWQFARRRLARFRRWLAALNAVDKLLFRLIPPLRRLAWFRVYVVTKSKAKRSLTAKS
jgi:SAM-dependent methyltransferase